MAEKAISKSLLAAIVFACSAPFSLVHGHDCHGQYEPRPNSRNVHTVVEGESLWKISAQISSSGRNWPQLWKANDQLCKSNLIYPGNELSLPAGWSAVIQDEDMDAGVVDLSTELTIDTAASNGQLENRQFPTSDEIEADLRTDGEPASLPSELDGKLRAISHGNSDSSVDPTAEVAELVRNHSRQAVAEIFAKWFSSTEQITAFVRYLEIHNNKFRYTESGPVGEDDDLSSLERKKVVTVLFSNGVGNLPGDALNSVVGIRDAIRERDPLAGDSIQFAYTYNVTRGIAKDVLEAFFQMEEKDRARGWHLMIDGVDDKGRAQANFLSMLAGKLSAQPAAELFTNYEQQIEDYKRAISSVSCGVVVVAHSQGNLFASWVYEKLDSSDQEHVRVISVASPASKVVHDGSHFFTNGPKVSDKSQSRYWKGDKVIGTLEYLAQQFNRPPPLVRKIVHVSDVEDFLGHGFVEAYIGFDDPAREKLISVILSEVEAVRELADDECEIYSSGPIPDPWFEIEIQSIIWALVLCVALALSVRYMIQRKQA